MTIIPFAQDRSFCRPRGAWRSFDRDIDQLVQATLKGAEYVPSLDVKESKDAYTVQADLPGLDKKDIQVQLENGVLSLKGTRKAEHQEASEDRTWHRVERGWGVFERSLRLGDGVDASKVSAEYKDGVLTVTVPKAVESQARSVEVR